MDELRIVHLDLKGAPPKLSFYEKFIPFVTKFGANGLLVEYEDTFPYWGELAELKSQNAYTLDEVRALLQLAKDNRMIVIPLVQTFGHFEFVLKHDKFRHLREVSNYPMALCPSLEDSVKTVYAMIDQVMQLHQDSKWFHIGADEVFHMNMCERCKSRCLSSEALYTDHVTKIARHVTNNYAGIQPIMWDDIFRAWSLQTLLDSGLGKIVEPMVWFYGREYCLDADLWSKYGNVFEAAWVATAFKGATGSSAYVTDIGFHLDNHLMWINVLKQERVKIKKFRGFALTGWQRYDHYAVLCELLPVAIPCLCLALRTLLNGVFSKEIHHSVSEELGFPHLIPCNPFQASQLMPQMCEFPGKEIYLCVNLLLRMNVDYERFVNDDRLNGWMTPYHLKRNYTNPVHIEHIVLIGSEVYHNMILLQLRMRVALSDVFNESTVDEWSALFLDAKIGQLKQIMDDAHRQIRIGGRVSDYDVSMLGVDADAMSVP